MQPDEAKLLKAYLRERVNDKSPILFTTTATIRSLGAPSIG
jgi:hypothetical protein